MKDLGLESLQRRHSIGGITLNKSWKLLWLTLSQMNVADCTDNTWASCFQVLFTLLTQYLTQLCPPRWSCTTLLCVGDCREDPGHQGRWTRSSSTGGWGGLQPSVCQVKFTNLSRCCIEYSKYQCRLVLFRVQSATQCCQMVFIITLEWLQNSLEEKYHAHNTGHASRPMDSACGWRPTPTTTRRGWSTALSTPAIWSMPPTASAWSRLN